MRNETFSRPTIVVLEFVWFFGLNTGRDFVRSTNIHKRKKNEGEERLVRQIVLLEPFEFNDVDGLVLTQK